MSTTNGPPPSGPRVFIADDPVLSPRREPDVLPFVTPSSLDSDLAPLAKRRSSWAARLVYGGAGLAASFWVGSWLSDLATHLIQRDDWLGVGLGFSLVVVVLGLVIWAIGEGVALWRLGRAGDLRAVGEAASANGIPAVQAYARQVRAALKHRGELAYAFAKVEDYAADAASGRALLAALDREVGGRLDAECVAAILATARRTTVITAISPFVVLDIAASLALNVRLLRRIAVLTGSRPGALATLKLMRAVASTLLLAGGLEASDSLLGDVIGGSLARTVSRKAGQGVLNGLLTVRLGLAALRLLRPIPIIETSPPTVMGLAARIIDLGGKAPSAEDGQTGHAPWRE